MCAEVFLSCSLRLSKHLPSPDTMSFNIDVDELENSHGATNVRKKAAKVVGENPPKEQGYILWSFKYCCTHQLIVLVDKIFNSV